MIIFKNNFLKLDYNPATDILLVDMPTVDNVTLPEVEGALDVIVEHVRNYDVKKLLVDARKTRVEGNQESYAALVAEFSRQLMTTRLQKLARIVSTSEVRESAVKKVYEEKKLPLEFRSFIEIGPAVEWLME